MAHGGKRTGAGRKPGQKNVRPAITEALSDHGMTPERAAQLLIDQAADGNWNAIKEVCHYHFGKPVEEVDLNHSGEIGGNAPLTASEVQAALKALKDES